MKQLRNRSGLTLVETLVAIIIGGVALASLAVSLSAGVLIERQERVLEEARNLARLQLEDIRNRWAIDAGYTTTGSVSVTVDAASWPYATSTAGDVMTLTMANASDLQPLENTIANLAPTTVTATYPTTSSGAVVTGNAGIYGINIPIPRSNGLRRDYIGQIIVGRTPSVGNDRARRVIVRIFAAQRNGDDLAFADGATGNRNLGTLGGDGKEAKAALESGALAVLIDDIAGPAGI